MVTGKLVDVIMQPAPDRRSPDRRRYGLIARELAERAPVRTDRVGRMLATMAHLLEGADETEVEDEA